MRTQESPKPRRTIDFVFGVDVRGYFELAIVRQAPEEVEAWLNDPVGVEVPVDARTVEFADRPPWVSHHHVFLTGPEPPKIMPPGSVNIDGPLVPIHEPVRVIAENGKIVWGGIYVDEEGGWTDYVRTPPMPVELFRRALEPYPIDSARAEEWRTIAQEDSRRATVLLRPGSPTRLALDPADLEPLLMSKHRRVREIAQGEIRRTRVRGRPEPGRTP